MKLNHRSSLQGIMLAGLCTAACLTPATSALAAGDSGVFSAVMKRFDQSGSQSAYRPVVNTTLPMFDTPGVRFDLFRLYANPGVRFGYDSNITNLPDTPAARARDAFTLQLTTPFALARQVGPTETRLSGRLDVTQFSANSNENLHNNLLSLDHVTKLTARLDTRVGISFTDLTDPRGTVSNNGPEPNRSNTLAAVLNVGYGAADAQARVEADVRLADQTYQNNSEFTRFMDRQTTDVAARFLYRVAPRTRALVEAQFIDTDFDDDTGFGAAASNFFANQDQSETRLSGGLRWDATAKTSGSVKVGQTRKQFDQAVVGRQDADAGFYDVNITWNPATYSQVSVNLGQNFAESFRTSGLHLNRRRSINWTHQWLERLTTTVSFSRTIDDFDNFRLVANGNTQVIERKDRLDTVTLSTNYRFSPSIKVGVELRLQERDSNVQPGLILPDGSVNAGAGTGSNFLYDREVLLFTISASF